MASVKLTLRLPLDHSSDDRPGSVSPQPFMALYNSKFWTPCSSFAFKEAFWFLLDPSREFLSTSDPSKQSSHLVGNLRRNCSLEVLRQTPADKLAIQVNMWTIHFNLEWVTFCGSSFALTPFSEIKQALYHLHLPSMLVHLVLTYSHIYRNWTKLLQPYIACCSCTISFSDIDTLLTVCCIPDSHLCNCVQFLAAAESWARG